MALEQVVWGGVGGGDDHDPTLEQRLEQTAEDHRVGDVIDLEFVEAQQCRTGGDLVGQRRYRIGDVMAYRDSVKEARTSTIEQVAFDH